MVTNITVSIKKATSLIIYYIYHSKNLRFYRCNIAIHTITNNSDCSNITVSIINAIINNNCDDVKTT